MKLKARAKERDEIDRIHGLVRLAGLCRFHQGKL